MSGDSIGSADGLSGALALARGVEFGDGPAGLFDGEGDAVAPAGSGDEQPAIAIRRTAKLAPNGERRLG